MVAGTMLVVVAGTMLVVVAGTVVVVVAGTVVVVVVAASLPPQPVINNTSPVARAIRRMTPSAPNGLT